MKYMKKLLLALALFALTSFAMADGLMLNGVTSLGASSAVTAAGKGSYAIDIQIWSSAGSSAVVTIECRSYSTAPWWPCLTVTDPSTTGVYYSAPLAFQYRLNVTTYSSGTIFGTIVLYTE